MTLNSQMINLPSISTDILHDQRSNYTNQHNHPIYADTLNFHDQTNLLVHDEDDETEDNHNLIHDHDEDGLMCDPIYPSVYPH